MPEPDRIARSGRGADAAGLLGAAGRLAWLTRTNAGAAENPVDLRAAESGFRMLRRRDPLSLTALTWVFFFLYGPVEVALPVYVAHDIGASAQPTGRPSASARWRRTS